MSKDIAFEMAVSSVRFGVGVTREVGMDLAEMGARLVLVVTDPVVARLPPVRTVLDSLERNKIPYALYDRVRVEPSDESSLLWIASPAVARWVSRPSSAMTEPAPTLGRQAGAPADRAAHLALLRDLRHPGRQHASAGQFPGRPRHRFSPTAPRRPISASTSCRRSSARDFGWIGAIDTIERLEATHGDDGEARAISRPFLQLVRYGNLRPLDPQYVSSVDSGNLAGHLIALANACQDWCEASIEDDGRLAGIVDALSLVREEVESLRDRRRTETVTWRQLDESVALIFTDACRLSLAGETLPAALQRSQDLPKS